MPLPTSGRSSRIPARWAVLALLLAFSSGGCLGPRAVKFSRLKYNEAFRKTSAEQALLNIVRLRYADTPVFLDLPSITSQFEATAAGSYSYGQDGQGPGLTNLGGMELMFRDSPTLSFQPKVGEEFGRSLARPLDVELIRLVLATTNISPFLVMAVNDINDISNASEATAMIPQVPAENSQFRALAAMLDTLEQRGDIELAAQTKEVDTSDSLPIANVRGQDLIQASQTGYAFRASGNDHLLLKRRQKVLAVKVHPRALHSPELDALAQQLGLAPGLEMYPIRSELLDEEDDEDDELGSTPNPLGEDTIYFHMRSTMEIMTFLSKGVHVPARHAESGEAPTIRDVEGCPFDWTDITRGVFEVCSGTKRPPESVAEVAVPYRGYWFWIDRRDAASRATLTTLELLISLQDTKDENAGPLLTLPVGG